MVEKENIPDWGAAIIALLPDARVSGANAECKVSLPGMRFVYVKVAGTVFGRTLAVYDYVQNKCTDYIDDSCFEANN